MIGVLIITHGGLAHELMETTRFIVGDVENMSTLSIDAHEGAEDIRKKLEESIKQTDQGEGVLVLTDMFGGTPANMSLAFLDQARIEVITGVNLPMLIKLASCRSDARNLRELARFAANYGQRNITVASDLLKSRRAKKEPGSA